MGYRQMGRDSGRLREEIRKKLLDAGAAAVGFAEASEAEDDVVKTYDGWIADGNHAGMDYMLNHREVRKDARLLLEGAKTIISMAFSYQSSAKRDSDLKNISEYALLPDYHKWIKKLIRKSGIGELLGEENKDWRICVDTAPLFERYWAQKSGIAVRGLNGAAIVPGAGAKVFLAEIISTAKFESDIPLHGDCERCGACIKACPTGALTPQGIIDCNKCISYLTIEHRGEWTDPRHREAMATEEGRASLFGCDRCISACPHNNPEVRAIVEPLPEVIKYTSGNPPARSALKRAGIAGLTRNLNNHSL